MKKTAAYALIFALSLLFAGKAAFAQCETPADANAALRDLSGQQVNAINQFITNHENYIDTVMRETSISETVGRMDQFSGDLLGWLNKWWEEGLHVAQRSQAKELHIAQVDQSLALGRMVDADLMVDEKNRKAVALAEATRRYGPSDRSCEIDTILPGQTRAREISRALNRGLAEDDSPRRRNAQSTESSVGRGAEIAQLWQNYMTQFCDRDITREQACNRGGMTTGGAFPGVQKDIPALLWGSKQTIDLSNPDNLMIVQQALRYFTLPLSPEPLPPRVAETAAGHTARMARQHGLAFTNTIYNTMGQMLSERAGGSKVNTQLMRAAAGIPAAEASTDASYRELQEMMTKDRFRNPESVLKLIEGSPQTVREQIFTNALKLQAMNDIYRRSEELLFMEAATYSRELYEEMPGRAITSEALRK